MATINLPNEGDFPWDLNPAITAINAEVEATNNLVTTGRLSDTSITSQITSAVAPKANSADVNAALATKANTSDVYSKTATDSAIATEISKTSAARKRRVNFLGGTPSGTNTALNNVLYRVPFRIPHKGARLWLSLQNQANGTPITGATWTMTGAAVAPASLDGNGAPDGNGSAPFTRIAVSTPAPADGSALVIGPIDAAALPGLPGDLMVLSIGVKTTGFTNGFAWARSTIPVFYRGGYADTDVMTQTITPAGTTPMYTDFAMLWETNLGVLTSLLVGDSMTEGFGAGQWLSVPQRLAALTSSAVASVAQSGVTAQAVAGFGPTHPYWTKAGMEQGLIPDQALVNLGSNDLNSGRTSTQIISDLTSIFSFLTNKGVSRVFGATITPRSFPAGYVLTGVAAGVTSFTSNYNPGTGPIQLGQTGATVETVTVSSVSGSASPFTITLSSATTKAHAAGDIVAKTTGTSAQVAESERVKFNISMRETNPLGLIRVIDYDAALRDATNPTILTVAKSSDTVHPNAAGYEDEAMLARAIVAR